MAKKKVVENGSLNVLMPKLMKIKDEDLLVEKKRKKWGWIAGISIIIGFLGFLAATVPGIPLLFIIPGIAVPCFVVALIIYILLVRRDLDNRKLDTALKFVEMMGQDVPDNANMAIFVDFGDYQSAGKLLSKEGGMMSVKEMSYEHPWFKCTGALYDGNRFEMEVVQCIKRKEKRKRKYTKVKEKIVEKATLSLKLNPRIYPSPETVAQQVTTGQLPQGFIVNRSLGRNRVLKIAAATPPAVIVNGRYGVSGDYDNLFDGDKLLGLVIDAYSGLQKARPEEGAAPA